MFSSVENQAQQEPGSAQAFLSAAVEPELKQALIERAAANERSTSAELRIAVREHLERERPSGPPKE